MFVVVVVLAVVEEIVVVVVVVNVKILICITSKILSTCFPHFSKIGPVVKTKWPITGYI